MTSDGTAGTWERCEVCPGPGRCGRERSASLAGAYDLGCRSREATDANAGKARARRARLRGESPAASGAWTDTEQIPAREPTGDTCSRCESPLYWEHGRGAAICRNQHWELAPGTRERIADNRQTRTRVTTDARAEINARIETDVARRELQSVCDSALAEMNTTQLREAANLLTKAESWNEANTARYRAIFESLASQIKQADTMKEIETLSGVFRDYHDSQQYSVVRALVNQGYADMTQALNYRAQGTGSPTRFIYMQNPNRIVKVNPNGAVNGNIPNRTVTASVLPKALPPSRDDDDDYDDDESDDDGREYNGRYSSIVNAPDNTYVALASNYANYRRERSGQRERNGECYFKGHHNIFNDNIAVREVAGTNSGYSARYRYGTYLGNPNGSDNIRICGSKKCLQRAERHFMSLGYENCTTWELA